jgi:hypothetical protein
MHRAERQKKADKIYPLMIIRADCIERRNTMSKLNGWEYHNCTNIDCPARKAERFDGFNSGRNGGRICWYVKSISSPRKERCEQSKKCAECKFFDFVAKEEGSNLTIFV